MTAYVKPNAFTFIDLMVSLVLVGLFVALLLPSAVSARKTAGEITCMKQIRAYSQAMFVYQADQGTMPAAALKAGGEKKRPGGPFWFATLEDRKYLGADPSDEMRRCPLVMKDLPNYVSENTGKSDTRSVFTYAMNAFLGGLDNNPSDPQAEYELKPLRTDQVPNPDWTVLIAERPVPHTMAVGGHRVLSMLIDFRRTGIPHIDEILPDRSWKMGKDFVLQGRAGTSNLAFVDGSVRSVPGKQYKPKMFQKDFENGEKFILDPSE